MAKQKTLEKVKARWELPIQGCNADILEEEVNDMKPIPVAMMKGDVPRASAAAHEGFAAQSRHSLTLC